MYYISTACEILNNFSVNHFQVPQMKLQRAGLSHSCAQNKQFSPQNSNQPLKLLKEPLTKPCTQPYLLLTSFLPFFLAVPLLCTGTVHSEMERLKAASSCSKCQQCLVPPQDMGAEATSLAIVPTMSSHTRRRGAAKISFLPLQNYQLTVWGSFWSYFSCHSTVS